MNDIKQKALALVNAEIDRDPTANGSPEYEALCRAIEQHEAFRQEVSDEIAKLGCWPDTVNLQRFIIAKPDPLVEAMAEWQYDPVRDDDYSRLRAALAKRGLEIREKG